ncbi:MAG: CBS domain-containing protein [Proteobacteria bacterium]|jgi:CBS domain-containing protein|nr:CBS domain-containing protein [Pseudomonadota bacterium]|tara:strand:+ start:266 stop:706 length:441 start_codon:yes stop_codon:yes gene_type:complete
MTSENENNLISKILTRKVISINENQTVYDAIKLLSENKIGALPVINNQMKLCGIISERDIIHKMSENKKIDFSQVFINSIMTYKVITCIKNTQSNELMKIMTINKIRHIPILEKDSLIGIVSIGDVVKRLLEKFNLENEELKSWLY